MTAPNPREAEFIKRILKHEGGFVNDPRDAGGATNRGVTIGTMRILGMDLNGDGDVDVQDVKRLTEADAVQVYKSFYADPVQARFLPKGLDYAVVDFAVNAGPARAIQHLQRAVGMKADGSLGPITMGAVARADVRQTINRICDSRLAFLQGIRGGRDWAAFGRGWQKRVDAVRATSLQEAP